MKKRELQIIAIEMDALQYRIEDHQLVDMECASSVDLQTEKDRLLRSYYRAVTGDENVLPLSLPLAEPVHDVEGHV